MCENDRSLYIQPWMKIDSTVAMVTNGQKDYQVMVAMVTNGQKRLSGDGHTDSVPPIRAGSTEMSLSCSLGVYKHNTWAENDRYTHREHCKCVHILYRPCSHCTYRRRGWDLQVVPPGWHCYNKLILHDIVYLCIHVGACRVSCDKCMEQRGNHAQCLMFVNICLPFMCGKLNGWI